MLGAGQRIPTDALSYFAAIRVRIFAHLDPPDETGERHGFEADARWEEQLSSVGATVTTFDLSSLTRSDGLPVADLNDVARIAVEDFDAEPELSNLMTF